MKAGGGHAKGADFERNVSKLLSKWASHGDRDDIFWRTPGSGARATRVPALAHGGDICATHEVGRAFCAHVYMELKSYKKIDWRNFLLGYNGQFHKFWHKLRQESFDQRKLPLLVAKENHQTAVLITDADGHAALFGGRSSLITTCSGMYIHAFETLLEQSYEGVCNRLERSS